MRALFSLAFAVLLPGTAEAGSNTGPIAITIEEGNDDRCMARMDGRFFDIGDQAALDAAFAAHDAQKSRPEVHVTGDTDIAYRCVGGLIQILQRRGYSKIGFLAETAPD